ncbi:hypothetical protein KJR28_08655 [Streptococcus lutetiensis]|uniref:hypothetical protein n=1 Tax=Streptococcus lutetiensis TaxID=150055 RepID=UPI0009EB49D5|nr:hypothetical protein [Streptococcus lutetiensis]MBT0948300.1 hypothetical protein [Streptococcus lutetiensis]
MTILAIVFGILLIFAIVRVVQIKMGVTKRFGYHYTITMYHGLKLPDLIKNDNLGGKIKIISATNDTCKVQSQINDTELKTTLMKDYQLDSTQVSVEITQ